MAVAVGDYESVLTGGLGHSGGTLPDGTEVATRGHWAGLDPIVGNLTHFAIQIDMTDLTTATDATRGLYSGFFRWVTDRPQYDGVTVVPTGENEGNIWKEGILIGTEQLSPIDRIININKSGDYGSLSGMNLAIDNTSDYNAAVVGFDDYLETNGYEIINRPVKAYAVIDDEFYQVWGGIISKTQYDEKVYLFELKDIFEKAHKPLPPSEVTLKNYPSADSKSIGKSIPVIFGDVLRSELLNVTGRAEAIIIGRDRRTEDPIDITAADEYNVSSEKPYLDIRTRNQVFTANYFSTEKFYLVGFKGTDESVLILDNDATANDVTRIYLGKKLSVTIATFNSDHAITAGARIPKEVWYFKIFNFSIFYLASTKEITEFSQNSLNDYELVQYDTDEIDYKNVNELINDVDTDEAGNIPHPNVSLINNKIDLEGDYTRDVAIKPDSISFIDSDFYNATPGTPPPTNDFDGDTSVLLDKNRSTKLSASGIQFAGLKLVYEVVFPDEFVIDGLEDLFLVFDSYLELSGAIDVVQFDWTLYAVDPVTGRPFSDQTASSYPGTISGTAYYNFVPNEYYVGGSAAGQDSDFEKEISGTFLSDTLKINSDLVDNFKKASVSRFFYLEILITTKSGGAYRNNVSQFWLRQIGFYGSKNLNTQDRPLYIKTKGEPIAGNETANVYRAFQHILESYDEIPSADIDYGNLGSELTRSDWRVGRQVKQKKLSSVYLKELASHSFVGIFPDRRGKRHLKSFLDDTDNIWTHTEDNGTIIKGSITKFDDTPINELCNDFRIEYDWNPGLKQFNKSIFVTNTDARTEVDPYSATFPTQYESTGSDTDYTVPGGLTSVTINADGLNGSAVLVAVPSWAEVGGRISFEDGSNNNFYYATITGISGNTVSFTLQKQNEIAAGTYTAGTLTDHGTGVIKWTTWVGGINDYVTAKEYWEICYNSWLKTQTVNKLPESLGKCYWFIDGATYDGIGSGDDGSAAHLYLANLISWTTRQKKRAIYSIPFTKQNVTIDLLDVVKFKDQKYTNGDFLTGYVEKVKINPGSDRIDLETILRPVDLEIFPPGADLIIETGDAPDTITESGAWPNTITETGV